MLQLNFYLNDKHNTEIMFFNEMQSNPFQVGDCIALNVDVLTKNQLESFFNPNTPIEENNKKIKMFNGKTIKILEKLTFVRFNLIGEPKTTIEFYCELINE